MMNDQFADKKPSVSSNFMHPERLAFIETRNLSQSEHGRLAKRGNAFIPTFGSQQPPVFMPAPMSTKQLIKLETTHRKIAMETSIGAENKGFKLLQKMGFKYVRDFK